MEQIDITIIGAGVIGLAVAERLSSEDRTLVILEANSRHGRETSSRNSEVIHAGMYYPSGSLKARFCVRGKDLIYEYAEKHDIKCQRTGKIILAYSKQDENMLAGLLELGKINGLHDLKMISAAEVSRLEPCIKPGPALLSPSTGIFSADLFMDSLLARAQERGAILLTSSPCTSIERTDGGYKICAQNQEPFVSRVVINCAGLNADKVAAMAGVDIAAAGYQQHFFKGEYFRLKGGRKISMLVYPPPGPVSVGMHLTPDVSGGVRVGPSAFKFDKKDYSVDEGHRKDFLAGASLFFDGLKESDLMPDTSGLRPKLKSADGHSGDFIIRREEDRGLPGFINLVGMDSPGLT
ncbi:MAG TPA: NAD(P)/FAD-dependent oxidoreductase, partial [Elusimicrobiales bacterium]|nr:NAD(P)/FAD-dependent oxidoreductase [Elusimicrobiales bacterium]